MLVLVDSSEDLAVVGQELDMPVGQLLTPLTRFRNRGKWVHVGRVNTPERMAKFLDMGVDSCDGSGISRFSWMRKEIADLKLQPKLLEATA